jgi:hypothetical protein
VWACRPYRSDTCRDCSLVFILPCVWLAACRIGWHSCLSRRFQAKAACALDLEMLAEASGFSPQASGRADRGNPRGDWSGCWCEACMHVSDRHPDGRVSCGGDTVYCVACAVVLLGIGPSNWIMSILAAPGWFGLLVACRVPVPRLHPQQPGESERWLGESERANQRTFERPAQEMCRIGLPGISAHNHGFVVCCMSDCLSDCDPCGRFHCGDPAGRPWPTDWQQPHTPRGRATHRKTPCPMAPHPMPPRHVMICLVESHSWRGREREEWPQ